MMISVFERIENTVGKGENTGYQHFLLFPHCFPKPYSLGSLKSGFCGKELTLYSIDTQFDASKTDIFWKHCGIRRNCSL